MQGAPSSDGSIRMRPARADDAVRLRNLHVCSIRELARAHYTPEQIQAWSGGRVPEQYRRWMSEASAMIVAQSGRRIVGFGTLSEDELKALFVDPLAVGRGIGTALLEALEQVARERGAETLACRASLNAAGFYRSRGFRGRTPGSYRFGGVVIPFVLMSKKL